MDTSDEITVKFLDLMQDVLLDRQRTELRARIIRETVNSPFISRAYLYGNDTELAQVDVPFSNDTILNISFDWHVVHSLFKDSNGVVEFSVFVEDTNGVRYYADISRIAEILTPSADNPETLVAMLYQDITGEPASAAVAREMYENALELNDPNVDLARKNILQLVLSKTSKQLENVIDLVGAYHALYGSFYDSFSEFETIIEQWLPQFRQDARGTLRRYIEEELYSLRYETLFGQLMFLEDGEDTPNNLLQNRSTFVDRHFFNKYSKYPSLVQRSQCNI